MNEEKPLVEPDQAEAEPDPDEEPIRKARVHTQPYDLVVESMMSQIDNGTVYLRPLSNRPNFQRGYVWSDELASRLIESILLNVPIPPCYLSQNENYEMDVIDGQQRIYSIYRFVKNHFKLSKLEVLKDLVGKKFHELPMKIQRQLNTHTLRLVAITNESDPEIKFDVFQRLNTNTVPLNAQELRNCVYRGALNDYLQEAATYPPWLKILQRSKPDPRMRDEELVLRFFAFSIHGLTTYKTPQKHWLNMAAKEGRVYSGARIAELKSMWTTAIDTALVWFEPKECFRRPGQPRVGAINRALYDLVMQSARTAGPALAQATRARFRQVLQELLVTEEFSDLISRAVDHKKRTLRRFELWQNAIGPVLE